MSSGHLVPETPPRPCSTLAGGPWLRTTARGGREVEGVAGSRPVCLDGQRFAEQFDGEAGGLLKDPGYPLPFRAGA